jgi:hypothetical protein
MPKIFGAGKVGVSDLSPMSRADRLARQFYELEAAERERLEGTFRWHSVPTFPLPLEPAPPPPPRPQFPPPLLAAAAAAAARFRNIFPVSRCTLCRLQNAYPLTMSPRRQYEHTRVHFRFRSNLRLLLLLGPSSLLRFLLLLLLLLLLPLPERSLVDLSPMSRADRLARQFYELEAAERERLEGTFRWPRGGRRGTSGTDRRASGGTAGEPRDSWTGRAGG